jgi:hypothetical protein
MFNEVVFWKDTYDGEYAEGGIFTRAVDLKKVFGVGRSQREW